MSDEVDPPHRLAARLVRRGWNALLTVYYANTPSWRVLKAGALVFLGFFLWAGSNVLRSYRPWWMLRYTMAYGFLLVVYGPVHHLVVIPVYMRLRRQGTDLSLGGHLHLPNAGLAVFLAAVVVLGTFPVAPVAVDLSSSLEGTGADIDPDLLCVKHENRNGTTVHCHLSESRGVDRVVVESAGRRIAADAEPPFEFTVRESDLATVVGEKQFRVVLLDAGGNTVRRYTRRLSMIDRG